MEQTVNLIDREKQLKKERDRRHYEKKKLAKMSPEQRAAYEIFDGKNADGTIKKLDAEGEKLAREVIEKYIAPNSENLDLVDSFMEVLEVHVTQLFKY